MKKFLVEEDGITGAKHLLAVHFKGGGKCTVASHSGITLDSPVDVFHKLDMSKVEDQVILRLITALYPRDVPGYRTLAARAVLAKCEAAHQSLDDEEDTTRWNVQWTDALTLVRSLLPELTTVVGSPKPDVAALLEEWRTAPEHRIFVQFIAPDAGAEDADDMPIADVALVAQVGNEVESFEMDGNLFRPMAAGPWEGEDARDVYMEAIEWWKAQLDRIDRSEQSRSA